MSAIQKIFFDTARFSSFWNDQEQFIQLFSQDFKREDEYVPQGSNIFWPQLLQPIYDIKSEQNSPYLSGSSYQLQQADISPGSAQPRGA